MDITEVFQRNFAAVAAHHSQVAHRNDLARELRARIAPNTAAANLAPDRLAEAFQIVRNA